MVVTQAKDYDTIRWKAPEVCLRTTSALHAQSLNSSKSLSLRKPLPFNVATPSIHQSTQFSSGGGWVRWTACNISWISSTIVRVHVLMMRTRERAHCIKQFVETTVSSTSDGSAPIIACISTPLTATLCVPGCTNSDQCSRVMSKCWMQRRRVTTNVKKCLL